MKLQSFKIYIFLYIASVKKPVLQNMSIIRINAV